MHRLEKREDQATDLLMAHLSNSEDFVRKHNTSTWSLFKKLAIDVIYYSLLYYLLWWYGLFRGIL